LGFAAASDDLHAFTDRDARAMAHISSLVRLNALDEETSLALTRAVGQSVAQLAAWQVELLSDYVAARRAEQLADPQACTADLVDLVTELADDFEPLVTYAWRRHLTSALGTHVVDLAPPDGVVAGRRSVGLVDMVDFTGTIRRLGETGVARLVQEFEEHAANVVTEGGGRLVKSVGDAVLFMTREAPDAVQIGMRAQRELAHHPLPQVHIGIATGPVVNRLGDIFGTTVNRASRIAGCAPPGGIVIDGATASAAHGVPGLVVQPWEVRQLKGLGDVQLYTVTRSNYLAGQAESAS
jgi:adenylate cyclase